MPSHDTVRFRKAIIIARHKAMIDYTSAVKEKHYEGMEIPWVKITLTVYLSRSRTVERKERSASSTNVSFSRIEKAKGERQTRTMYIYLKQLFYST
jgi:hypothetical protein